MKYFDDIKNHHSYENHAGGENRGTANEMQTTIHVITSKDVRTVA